MSNKKSKAELIRLLESGIREVGNVDARRFYVLVKDVITTGSPPERMEVYVVLRFLPGGAPYCCGEPLCYSRVFSEDGMEELGDWLARQMGLKQEIAVELKVGAEYYPDIEFKAHLNS